MTERLPFALESAPRWLSARFAAPQRTLGWTLLHPGFALARDVVWVEVRDGDLPVDIDPAALLRARLDEAGLTGALAFLTARNVLRHHLSQRRAETIVATCLTTVGLGNGERVGARRPQRARAGTINTLVHVSKPLTDGAMVEAISIATQARTAALLEARGLGSITGTGTDCIVVAAPAEGEPTAWAGLHTAAGEAIGGAVYAATREGVEAWDREFPA